MLCFALFTSCPPKGNEVRDNGNKFDLTYQSAVFLVFFFFQTTISQTELYKNAHLDIISDVVKIIFNEEKEVIHSLRVGTMRTKFKVNLILFTMFSINRTN